jgi:uncharacterized membrane protein
MGGDSTETAFVVADRMVAALRLRSQSETRLKRTGDTIGREASRGRRPDSDGPGGWQSPLARRCRTKRTRGEEGSMTGENPIQVVVAAFADERGADRALNELEALQWQGVILIDNAAALSCDPWNKLHIREIDDMGGGKGATIGGVIGGVLGLLAGPVGWGIGLGALTGGLAAKLRDAGFPDARLQELGRDLKPGSSALVALVKPTSVRDVERELEQQGAAIVTEELSKEIIAQLEAGRDVTTPSPGVAQTIETDQGETTAPARAAGATASG